MADAFVNLWNKEKQFGQFVNSQTGEIIVGGSTSAAIVPAALALAFNNSDYLKVAEESADLMYKKYVKKGITSGGPGDALQNCDSESGYAMLESFTILYDKTGNRKWRQAACEMAAQFSMWVAAYSYEFPKGCLFDTLCIKSTGAVFANTQNKHGSPGICTYSGIALLRLYRITGDSRYLRLLKEIAFNIPQYMSYPSRKIAGMDAGWINERVSTTDWFEGIGEIFPGSTWAETALLLSTVELPGIYIDKSEKVAVSFDNLTVKFLNSNEIKIYNPTKFNSIFTIFVDTENSKNTPLNTEMFNKLLKNEIKPSQTKVVKIN